MMRSLLRFVMSMVLLRRPLVLGILAISSRRQLGGSWFVGTRPGGVPLKTHATEDDEGTCAESACTSECEGPEAEVREDPLCVVESVSVVVLDSVSSDSMSLGMDG